MVFANAAVLRNLVPAGDCVFDLVMMAVYLRIPTRSATALKSSCIIFSGLSIKKDMFLVWSSLFFAKTKVRIIVNFCKKEHFCDDYMDLRVLRVLACTLSFH